MQPVCECGVCQECLDRELAERVRVASVRAADRARRERRKLDMNQALEEAQEIVLRERARLERKIKTVCLRVTVGTERWLERGKVPRARQLEADLALLRRLMEAAQDDRYRELPFGVVVGLLAGKGGE